MPSTRGKKRSPPETQKRNVNPRVGETREVTIASGHQKGQKKTQKLQHTPGGANLAWANEPCTKCTGSKRCQNCKDQMKMAISKARQKGKKAAAAAAAAEEEEEEEEQEEKGELERRAETLEIGTPGERAKLRSQDPKARRRAQKLISQVRDCALARLLCSSSLVTVSPPPSLAIQAIARAGEKLLEQGFETKDTDPASAFECFLKAAEVCENAEALYRVGGAFSDDSEEFGKKEDQEKALRYYEKAGEKGHAGALYRIGDAYECGHRGKEVNIETCIKYYEKSAKLDPELWADIISEYGDVRTFVLIRKGTLVIDMTLATEDEKKSQRDWLARCYGADQPSPSASGQPSSREGEGDSGESGPLATSTLPWGDPAKARDMAQEFFHGIGPPGQPDQPSPSASGQPSSQDADPNAATMPNFDGYTDSAKVAAISYELREMGCDVPNENEIERELRKAKGNQQQAIGALTATN